MKKLLSLILIASFFFPLFSAQAAGFSFERSITIDHTKAGSSDSSNFPVLVASTTYAFLATTGQGGQVQNGEGFDVGFYSDSACTSKMAWEVEKYTPTTGDVVYWVSVPTVSHTSDTVFYLCYGNSSITTDQSATTTVWSNAGNYVGVYHLPNGSSLTANDSTASAANGTITGSTVATTGKIDGGVTYAADDDKINMGNPSNVFSITGNLTVSTWVNWTTSMTNNPLVARWSTNPAYVLLVGLSANTLEFIIRVGGVSKVAQSVATYNDGNWHLVHGVFDGSNVLLYVDGALVKTGTATAGPIDNNDSQGLSLGEYNAVTADFFHGSQDEVRVSNTNRSANWIATEYNNEVLPDKAGGSSGFYTLGSETPIGGVTNGSSIILNMCRWIISKSQIII